VPGAAGYTKEASATSLPYTKVDRLKMAAISPKRMLKAYLVVNVTTAYRIELSNSCLLFDYDGFVTQRIIHPDLQLKSLRTFSCLSRFR